MRGCVPVTLPLLLLLSQKPAMAGREIFFNLSSIQDKVEIYCKRQPR